MTTTKVDAVMLKRQGALALAAQLATMSPEQQRRFWEDQTRALHERQQAKRAERAPNPLSNA
ncbi:MAG: hypothetical protein U0Z44_10435 [Kouleothrix sp.]|jgi:hypothetical protein|nr:hypothetical protein [Kouleothrix sp.]